MSSITYNYRTVHVADLNEFDAVLDGYSHTAWKLIHILPTVAGGHLLVFVFEAPITYVTSSVVNPFQEDGE